MAENVFTGDASNYAEGDGMLGLSQEQRAFVEEVAYYANQEYSRRKAAGEDWVLPSVCVSQACLESGFGSATTVNIFGIKGAGTSATTQEEYVPGQKTTIVDSFVSHGTIEEDVKVYYDLICGTGAYEGWDIYSAARNNEDAADAVQQIRNAGYATSSSYSHDVISIMDQYNIRQFDTGIADFDYNEAGYQEGCDIYEDAVKIITEMEQSYEKAENSIKSACASKPAVDYQSIIQFENIKSIIQTLKELLEKTKVIADEEKYIAEQYDDDGGAGLNSFQASAMATTVQNYAFDNMDDFKNMVSSYQNSNSNEVFSNWLQSYSSTNGIESKVVNMSQYEKAIKDSGAVLSSDYVVSKASFLLAETATEKTEEKEQEKTKTNTNTNTNTNTSGNSSAQFRASGGTGGGTGGVVSGGVISSNIETQSRKKMLSALLDKDKKTDTSKGDDDSLSEVLDSSEKPITETETTTATDTLKTTETDTTKAENSTATVTAPTTSESTTTHGSSTFTAQTTTTSESQPVTSSTVYPSSSEPVASETSFQTEPATGEETTSSTPELPIDLDDEDPVVPVDTDSYDSSVGESTIQKVPNVPNISSSSPKQSTGSAAIPVVLGLGATAAVGGGAAYYIHKKHQNEEYDEYDDEEYDEDFVQDDDVVVPEEDDFEEKAIPELNDINDGNI